MDTIESPKRVENAQEYDVIVVGAGAAGMMAAAQAASRGKHTLLLEKNRKPGVKILISGGTRCNLTHDCDERGIMSAFGSAGAFLHSALAALGVRELLEMFASRGLKTYIEAGTGKHFPVTDRALDVVNVLVGMLRETGVVLALEEPVLSFDKVGDAFVVQTPRRCLSAPKLILATGGMSYPKCGTTGDGYAWLQHVGHSLRAPRPALAPLTSNETWVTEISGITLDALVRVVDPFEAARGPTARSKRLGLGPGVLMERRGALLFTHFGLSGPAAMDVSRAVSGRNPSEIELRVDFLPDLSTQRLEASLRAALQAQGKRQLLACMPELIQKRLAAALLIQAGLSPEKRAGEVGKSDIAMVIKCLKDARILVSGTQGYSKAEVTAGGVPLDEVDSRNMESKLVPGLYIVGELLDLDGFIGGYNFQAAFATGYLAGNRV